MSRKDEIIETMRKHENAVRIAHFENVYYVNRNDYRTVATEIEKLFEVEGETKIDYVLQRYTPMHGWADSSIGWEKEVLLSKTKNAEIRAVKRTTIDEVIE
jgi:hypothetical protein